MAAAPPGDLVLRVRVGKGPGGGEREATEGLAHWLGGTEELNRHARVEIEEVPVPVAERPSALGSADFVYNVLINLAATGASGGLMLLYRLLRSHIPLRSEQVALVVEFPDGHRVELEPGPATVEEMRRLQNALNRYTPPPDSGAAPGAAPGAMPGAAPGLGAEPRPSSASGSASGAAPVPGASSVPPGAPGRPGTPQEPDGETPPGA